MSISLVEGDAVTLLINNTPMFAFVETAGHIPKLVVYNPETGTIKRFSGISSIHLEERLKLSVIDTKDLPLPFAQLYDRHFLSYSKNDHVVFEQDGQIFEGIVLKVGNYVKVKFKKDGKDLTFKGESHLFKPVPKL